MLKRLKISNFFLGLVAYHFYRASAKRDIVLPILCLSVCPMPVYCVKTNRHIVTIFDILIGAPVSFLAPLPLQFQWEPPKRGR